MRFFLKKVFRRLKYVDGERFSLLQQYQMSEMLHAFKKAWGERLVTYTPEGKFVLIRPCGRTYEDFVSEAELNCEDAG